MFGIVGLLTSALHLRLTLDGGLALDTKKEVDYFNPRLFFGSKIFSPTILQSGNIFFCENISRRYESFGSVGGIVNEKENIAIASKEQQLLKDMLRVPDAKVLTVWSDKEAHWDLMKRDSFLVADDEGWKCNSFGAAPVVGAMSSGADFSSFLCSPDKLLSFNTSIRGRTEDKLKYQGTSNFEMFTG